MIRNSEKDIRGAVLVYRIIRLYSFVQANGFCAIQNMKRKKICA
jgi:hypothetical protein